MGERCGHGTATCNDYAGRTDDGTARESRRVREGERGLREKGRKGGRG